MTDWPIVVSKRMCPYDRGTCCHPDREIPGPCGVILCPATVRRGLTYWDLGRPYRMIDSYRR